MNYQNICFSYNATKHAMIRIFRPAKVVGKTRRAADFVALTAQAKKTRVTATWSKGVKNGSSRSEVPEQERQKKDKS
jgi:hypothetical protein